MQYKNTLHFIIIFFIIFFVCAHLLPIYGHTADIPVKLPLY